TRNMQKALLRALLMPLDRLKMAETELDFTSRLVITEEIKDLPYGEVWSEFCRRMDVPDGPSLIEDLEAYQDSVSSRN
ncbi:MAG: L-rhamnose isomerase, partial [Pseudomonadota bacterium]